MGCRLCIISGEAGEDVAQVIIGEAKKMFETVLFVPLRKIVVSCRGGKTIVSFHGKSLEEFDVVWARIFGDDFVLGETVLDALENSGVYVQGSAEAYQLCSHKFYTVKLASKIGIPVPNSSLSVSPGVSLKMAKREGFPVVVKLLSGFGGKGVMLANSEQEFTPILDTMQVFNEFMTTQEFIRGGLDCRALVIGVEVVGIRRTGAQGDWRANVSGGGSAEFYELDENIKKIALSAAALFGTDVCSVDFLISKEGPKLVEINFAPGMIQKFFGSTLAEKIIAYFHSKAIERKTAQGA
ncbi:MAG: RimK family alpha-L-glutamate ligase [Candidatus Diapherotrites archaeon]|uniref:RimK family alpha-L-glutamate ligase n=1 Tax=Candidatus Iainarchaeum sp. TaxID=3101447 RepID=A0A8T3YK33_9ARCH|nr:RimK family alpha-L-glutamate ligase [Candidatus Diapherotrites archaeon]